MLSFGTFLALAAKQAWRHRRRTVLVGLCVALGNAVLILQLAQGRGLEFAFMNNMIHSLSGHIQIQQKIPGENSSLFDAKVQGMLPLVDPEQLEVALHADPRVLAATRRIRFGAMMSREDDNWSAFVVGVQPDSERKVCDAIGIKSGRFVVSGASEIVISETMARERKLVLGDSIVMLASTTGGSFNGMEFKVVGLLADTGLAKFYSRMVYVPLDRAAQLIGLRAGQTYELVVALHHTADADAVAASMAALRGAGTQDALQVRTWYDMAGLFLGILEIGKAFRAVMAIFLCLVVVILVFSGFSVYVFERSQEISTMLAIGFRKSNLLLIFVAEGVIVALFSSGIGLALGGTLAWWAGRVGIPAFNEAMTYVFAGPRLYPILGLSDMAALLLASCACAALAALLPIRRALAGDLSSALNRN